MADAVIRIGADTTELTVKLERAGDKVKDTGEKAAKGISKAVESLTGITPKLMGIAGALAAINAAAQMASNVATNQAQGNRAAGSRNIAISEAALRAGLSPSEALNWANTQERATSPEGKLAVLQAAAAENERRAGLRMAPMTQANVQAMMKSYDVGGDVMFGEGGKRVSGILAQPGASYNYEQAARTTMQVQTGMRGASIDQMAQSMFDKLPESTRNELVTRYIEGRTAAATQEQGEAQGTRARRGEAYRKELEVLNPYAAEVLNLADKLPVFGRASQDVFEKKAEREFVDLQRSLLRENQKANAGPPLPNLNVRTEGPRP